MGGLCFVHQPDVASDAERLRQAVFPTIKSAMPNVRERMVAPNESRLSCGALKKDSFHNLRAPAASSAC